MSVRYFALRDHVGVTPGGNLEPLVEEGMAIAVPTIVSTVDGPEVVTTSMSVVIRPADTLPDGAGARVIPGTRIIECSDPRIADGLLGGEKYEEIPPPTKQEVTHAVKALTDGRAEAGTHSPDPDDPDHPDNPAASGQGA
jgi:hypothetical protein